MANIGSRFKTSDNDTVVQQSDAEMWNDWSFALPRAGSETNSGLRKSLLPLSLIFLSGVLSMDAKDAAAAPLRTVAISGDLAPGTEEEAAFRFFYDPLLNNLGQSAFRSGLWVGIGGVDDSTNTTIWSEGGGTLHLIAREGKQAPGTLPGTNFHDIGAPILNNSGQVVFGSTLRQGSGSTLVVLHGGTWSDRSGALAPVLLHGDPAPNTSPGAKFHGPQGSLLNSAGEIAIMGPLQQGSGGVTASNDVGTWSEGGGSLHLVAREGSQALGAPAGALFGAFTDLETDLGFQFNDAGQTAFLGILEVGSGGVLESNKVGVWSEGGGALHLVARQGSAAGTLAGVQFSTFEGPRLNSLGQTVFQASLTGSVVSGSNNSSIWSEGGGALHLVAREGSHAPGTLAGANFGGVDPFQTPLLNGAGQTAFVGGLLIGSGDVDSSNDSGIWSEGSGSLALVAREGTHAPGTPIGANFGEFSTYSTFSTLAFNSAGQAAFHTKLVTGGGGVTSSNDTGIWAVDRNGDLKLIVREGDLLDVDDGPGIELRTVMSLSMIGGAGNEGGGSSSFNDLGQLIFQVTFSDFSQGVFVSNLVSTVPEPASITLAAFALAGLLTMQRSYRKRS